MNNWQFGEIIVPSCDISQHQSDTNNQNKHKPKDYDY